MADLESRNTDSGTWLRLRAGYTVALSAHRADEEDDSPLTIYWRGRTDPNSLERFFTSALRDAKSPTVKMRAFTPTENLEFDAIRTPEDLLSRVPKGASFLRLEAAMGGRDQLDDELIVWARVDLAQVERGADAPDDIGVFLKPRRLRAVRDLLIRYISETQISGVSLNEVSDCVDVLSAYLRPDRFTPHMA
jgi:hypothetical protein